MQLWKSCEKLGHFDKHFEETPQGNILKIVILDTLKIAFWMEKLIQRWTFWPLFPKPGHFFRFSKGQGRSPLCYPLLAHLWLWLNSHRYPLICLNIFEKTVLPMPWLWICMIILHFQQFFKAAVCFWIS